MKDKCLASKSYMFMGTKVAHCSTSVDQINKKNS